jgi:hypothetical protein
MMLAPRATTEEKPLERGHRETEVETCRKALSGRRWRLRAHLSH